MNAFCELYASFITDLIALYPKATASLKKQKMWLYQNKNSSRALETFHKSITPYADRIMANDQTLFTGPGHMRIGRINWKNFSRGKPWDQVEAADRATVVNYLRQLYIAAEVSMKKSTESVEGLLKAMSGGGAGLENSNSGATGFNADALQQTMGSMMSNPLMKTVAEKLKKQIEPHLRDGKGPGDLMGMMLSGQLDMEAIQKDVCSEIEGQLKAGAITEEQLKAQNDQFMGAMQGSGVFQSPMFKALSQNPALLQGALANPDLLKGLMSQR